MKLSTLESHWVEAVRPSKSIILVLHGRGDSLEGFKWLPQELGLDHCHYLMLNAPDDWFGGYSWYDMEPHQYEGVQRSARLLDQVMEEIKAAGYPLDNVYLFGFSQGCLMSLEWGARSSAKLGGILGISGYCLDAHQLAGALSQTAKKTPWLITHGFHDEVLSYHRTQQQVQILQEAGLPIEFRSYQKGHTIDPHEELPDICDWFRLHLR